MYRRTPSNNYGSKAIARRYENTFPREFGDICARESQVREKIFIHELIASCTGEWPNLDQMKYTLDVCQHEDIVKEQKELLKLIITVGQLKEMEAMVFASLKLSIPERLSYSTDFDHVPVTTTLYRITQEVKKTIDRKALILIDSIHGPYYKGFRDEIFNRPQEDVI